MSILKRFVQDTAIYGLAAVLPRLMNLLLIALHTDILENKGYSENTAFYVGAAFLNVLLTYGMETAFFRFFSRSESKSKVYSTLLIALTITSLLAFAGLWLVRQPIADFLEIPVKYIGYLIAITILDTLVVAPFAYLRATGRPIRFTGIKMVNLFIYVGLNYFFLWYLPQIISNDTETFSWFEPDDLLQYIFIANLIASAATFLLIVPDFFKIKLVFDKKLFGQLWRYGWPIMIAGLAFVINEQLDKILLIKYINKDVAGAYAGCYKLAVFMTLFVTAFKLGAEPFFFNHAKSKNAPKTYATILKYFTVVGALGLVVVVCFIDLFKVLLIKNDSYYLAIGIVPFILLANLFLGIYHNLSVWYKLTDKTRYGMYFSIIGAVVTIAINVLLIPILGFMASAYATLVAYGSMMLISYFVGQKHYAIPYDLKSIGLYLLLAIGFSGLSFYGFRENYFVSGILLFVYLAVVFWSEKTELKRILTSKSSN
ncbi:MAG: polysaccharide biosynthesis C-terminal domain-containing protein [Leeuwenhoekiella sp.]